MKNTAFSEFSIYSSFLSKLLQKVINQNEGVNQEEEHKESKPREKPLYRGPRECQVQIRTVAWGAPEWCLQEKKNCY